MGRDHVRPDRLCEALERVLQRIDPEHRLRVYRLWTFWAEEVGPAIAARAEPAGYRSGVLSVRVSSAPWMQELQLMKETIRERLNARLGEPLIRDIYFVSGPTAGARGLAPAAQSAPAEAPPPAELLPPIRNAELAAVFQRLVRAHARRGPAKR